MKPNDKAIEAGYEASANSANGSVFGRVSRSTMKEILTAAYAAQLQSEDYAELVKELRKWKDWAAKFNAVSSHGLMMLAQAADALEAVLAERDTLKALLPNQNHESRAPIPTDWWSVAVLERRKRIAAEKERDALAARLAPVDDEELVEIRSHFPHKSAQQIRDETDQLIEKHRKSVRDWLEAARLAPVVDEALVEIAVRTHYGKKWDDPENGPGEAMKEVWRNLYRKPIAAIRPHIEAAERERSSEFRGLFLELFGALKKVVATHQQCINLTPETILKFEDLVSAAEEIAAAIRRGE